MGSGDGQGSVPGDHARPARYISTTRRPRRCPETRPAAIVAPLPPREGRLRGLARGGRTPASVELSACTEVGAVPGPIWPPPNLWQGWRSSSPARLVIRHGVAGAPWLAEAGAPVERIPAPVSAAARSGAASCQPPLHAHLLAPSRSGGPISGSYPVDRKSVLDTVAEPAHFSSKPNRRETTREAARWRSRRKAAEDRAGMLMP